MHYNECIKGTLLDLLRLERDFLTKWSHYEFNDRCMTQHFMLHLENICKQYSDVQDSAKIIYALNFAVSLFKKAFNNTIRWVYFSSKYYLLNYNEYKNASRRTRNYHFKQSRLYFVFILCGPVYIYMMQCSSTRIRGIHIGFHDIYQLLVQKILYNHLILEYVA